MHNLQGFNPYLPLWEYVPDGEPHVFDGRVYLYGSHDAARSEVYCPGNYVVWSAPVDNLKDWRCDGESYRRDQDPSNPDGSMELWAPDVAWGTDGRYYLYYCFPFYPEIGVAVSDSPAGPFDFYGHVHHPDGRVLSEYLPFDPAVLVDEDGRVYLYYGFAPAQTNPNYPIVPSPGAMVVELEGDMCTVKEPPKMCVPGGAHSQGTGFEGHAYYEAASIRKIGRKYYFVYSSELSHELCYAVSDCPDRGFCYGGTILSNGDVGLKGNTQPVYMTGNNHGGLAECGGQWYIFYHRQTHATEASRQGCAEPVNILPDGSIPQVEITSCGLNGGPLEEKGDYSAAIACHLTGGQSQDIIVMGQDRKRIQPYIYEEDAGEPIHYIANITDGTVFGFKYFQLEKLRRVGVTLRGNAQGTMWVSTGLGATPLCGIPVQCQQQRRWIRIWGEWSTPCTGNLPLYFTYQGTGALEVRSISLS